MSAIEFAIATKDKDFLKRLLDAFPEIDIRIESGFSVLAIVGTAIVPTATLALKVAEFLYNYRRQKHSDEELLSIHYKKGPGYVEISAKGVDEREVLARLRAIGGDGED
jgi:hypothetical protein